MIFKLYLLLVFVLIFSYFFFLFEKFFKSHGTEIMHAFQFVLMSTLCFYVFSVCDSKSGFVISLLLFFCAKSRLWCSYNFNNYNFLIISYHLMLQYLLIQPNIFIRSIFRTQSIIYGRNLFAKIQ